MSFPERSWPLWNLSTFGCPLESDKETAVSLSVSRKRRHRLGHWLTRHIWSVFSSPVAASFFCSLFPEERWNQTSRCNLCLIQPWDRLLHNSSAEVSSPVLFLQSHHGVKDWPLRVKSSNWVYFNSLILFPPLIPYCLPFCSPTPFLYFPLSLSLVLLVYLSAGNTQGCKVFFFRLHSLWSRNLRVKESIAVIVKEPFLAEWSQKPCWHHFLQYVRLLRDYPIHWIDLGTLQLYSICLWPFTSFPLFCLLGRI